MGWGSSITRKSYIVWCCSVLEEGIWRTWQRCIKLCMGWTERSPFSPFHSMRSRGIHWNWLVGAAALLAKVLIKGAQFVHPSNPKVIVVMWWCPDCCRSGGTQGCPDWPVDLHANRLKMIAQLIFDGQVLLPHIQHNFRAESSSVQGKGNHFSLSHKELLHSQWVAQVQAAQSCATLPRRRVRIQHKCQILALPSAFPPSWNSSSPDNPGFPEPHKRLAQPV